MNSIPRIISLFVKNSCKRSDMLTLDPGDIGSHWGKAVSSLNKALMLLQNRFGCYCERLIPVADIIPTLAIILSSPNYVDSVENRSKLERWYWRAVFSEYFSSATDTKAARAAKEWTDPENGWLVNDANAPTSVSGFELSKGILDGAARANNTVYRGVLCMLLSKGVLDFGKSRTPITLDLTSQIEDHHIYPKAFLSPYNIKGDLANTVLNRTPLLASTNKAIGNDAPHVYGQNQKTLGQKLSRSDLEGHCISDEIFFTPFTEEIYKAFLENRKSQLMKEIANRVQVDPIDIVSTAE